MTEPLGSGWLQLISADDVLLAFHRGRVIDGQQRAVCGEEPPEGATWRRPSDGIEQAPEDWICAACSEAHEYAAPTPKKEKRMARKKQAEQFELQEKATKELDRRTEDLPVPLTQSELLERGDRLAKIESELEAMKAYEEEVKATLKSDRARVESERSRLALVVRNKHEARPIEVIEVADFRSGMSVTRRQDTGERVRERALYPHERQEALKFDEPEEDAA